MTDLLPPYRGSGDHRAALEAKACVPDCTARGAMEQGCLVGSKPPLTPKQVWSIRLTLQREGRIVESITWR